METYKGDFYVPAKPEDKVPGILIIDENQNIELDLFGSFNDFFEERDINTSTIFGELFTGEKATLLSCRSKNMEVRFGVAQLEKFSAKLLLIGVHILSQDILLFNEITADIEQLAQWINKSGGQLSIEKGFKNFDFKYKQPEDIEFNLSDDLVASVYFRQTFPFHSLNFKIEEKTLFCIEGKTPKSLIEMIRMIRSFRMLLSFFVGTKLRINQLVLFSNSEIKQVINDGENLKEIHQEIKLYFNDQDPVVNKLKINDFFVTYEGLSNQFLKILTNWYSEKQEDLLPISNILLDCLVEKTLFEENQFLTAFQGVEAFHRRFLQNTKLLKDKHKQYMEQLLSYITDTELSTKLKCQLAFSYELTAKQRFTEIIELFRPVIPYITSEAATKWVKEMVDSRNYLTHLDPASKDKKASIRKLLHYTNLLKATLVCLIMNKIGVSNDKLKGVEMKYRNSIQYLLDNA